MKETKIKMRMCITCGKEFNIYTRPLIARFTCSEDCREVQRAKRQELRREYTKQRKEIQKAKRKKAFMIIIFVSFITGIIGAMVGGYIYNAMSMVGDPGIVVLIGFGVGFFAPIVIYINEKV